MREYYFKSTHGTRNSEHLVLRVNLMLQTTRGKWDRQQEATRSTHSSIVQLALLTAEEMLS